MMEYRGFTAKVEYDDSVGMLHGEVINAAPYPIVTFEASDVDGLRGEFHSSIEDSWNGAGRTALSLVAASPAS